MKIIIGLLLSVSCYAGDWYDMTCKDVKGSYIIAVCEDSVNICYITVNRQISCVAKKK